MTGTDKSKWDQQQLFHSEVMKFRILQECFLQFLPMWYIQLTNAENVYFSLECF